MWGNIPWLGCLILETPNIWKTSNDSRIELWFCLFFFFLISQRSDQDTPFDSTSGSLIHSYKLGAINSALEKKKNLASDTVSLFISINICFKADPPQYDKNASLFSQQSYSSLPCFIHKQSESSPFIYGYVWNAPSYDKHVREQKYHPNPVQGGENSATTHCSFQLWLVQHWIIYLHVPDML